MKQGKRRSSRWELVAAAACLFLIASGCKTSDPDPSPPGPTGLDDATLLCDWLVACPVVWDDLSVPRAFFLASGDPEAACLDWATRVNGGPGREAMEAAISAGRLQRDYMALGERLSDCSLELLTIDASPATGYLGAQEIGEPCSLDGECVDGAYCDFPVDQCPGACADRAPIGDPCAENRECESGYCGASDVCASLAFVTGAGNGSPCWETSVSATSRTLTNCAAGLYCSVVDDLCHPLPDIGDECENSWDAPCLSGLCLDSMGGVPRCVDITIVGEGADCDDLDVEIAASTVSVCDEYDGVECVGGTCVRPAAAAEGETCVFFDNYDSCESGTFCEWDAGGNTCVALGGTGESCSSSEECASGYCSFSTGECGPAYCDG